MEETNMTATYTLTHAELMLLWGSYEEIEDEICQLRDALAEDDIDEAKECEMRLAHAISVLYHAIPAEKEAP